MKIYRQGDVLLIKTDDLPENIVKKDNVLALGEKTGHYHEICGNVQTYKEVTTYGDTLNGVQWVVVEEPATLEHKKENKFTGDHSTLPIESGIYKVIVQKEYSAPKKSISREWD
jgi:hypothetical protein